MGRETAGIVDLAAGYQQTHPGSLPAYAEAMARRVSKHLRPARPLLDAGFARTEQRRDGAWLVQPVAAGRSAKEYLCPACNRRIAPGVAHVVAWRAEPGIGSSRAVDARRHLHTPCWARWR